jgi:GxxExxY protein
VEEPIENQVSGVIVDTAYQVYRELGPGMLESAYESVLAFELAQRGMAVRLQVPVPLVWRDLVVRECFRADMVVEDMVLIELKSVEHVLPVHKKQVITYLKLTGLRVGLLLNFGAKSWPECVHRLVNGMD